MELWLQPGLGRCGSLTIIITRRSLKFYPGIQRDNFCVSFSFLTHAASFYIRACRPTGLSRVFLTYCPSIGSTFLVNDTTHRFFPQKSIQGRPTTIISIGVRVCVFQLVVIQQFPDEKIIMYSSLIVCQNFPCQSHVYRHLLVSVALCD